MAFPDPIVAGSKLVVPAIESVDFQNEGVTGWQINRDGTATFHNLNIFGDVGAGNIGGDIGTFNDIVLPNYDSLDTTLDTITSDLSGRCVGFFQQTDVNIPLIGTTGVAVMNLDCFLQPNRIYTI